ncbi:putative Polyprotein [Cucumis melo var. makuwa]|uniref:Putative Polyprotein n=1 Tax=Cucumis melo var. makuwa TaxID=1194695 RepID=A0A5D3CWI0_CUCMM|nr:putative Polyprotein [Cucumis melo var. makuwa]
MDEISKTCADKEPSPNDVLTQALDTQESSGRCKTNLEKEEMNATTKVVKEEVNVDVIILNDQQEDAIDVRNEKEVIRDFNIKMSLPLKTILKFAEKGHWAFLAINAYDETVYYLDSHRTTSKVDIRYVTNTAITIFRSQKNIQTSRKQPIWKTMKIDTRTSYSQLELNEVRIELAELLGKLVLLIVDIGELVLIWSKEKQSDPPYLLLEQNPQEAQENYTTTEKDLLAIVFAIEKFRSDIVGSKVTVHSDHFAIRYLMVKKDAKPQLIRWIL